MMRPGELCRLEFFKRGWSTSSYFRVEGEIFNNGGGKKDPPVYKVEGKWNESVLLTNC